MKRRVVITGMSGISPIGNDWPSVRAHLETYRNAVARIEGWSEFDGLNTQIGARAAPFVLPGQYNLESTGSMGRVAVMATRTSELALLDAGLLGTSLITGGRVGISYGSSAGTPQAIGLFGKMLLDKSKGDISSTDCLKMMSHTAPLNIGMFFGITGRVITTSSACTSGSQGIGYAYETILSGSQTAMIAGGAEELSATQAAVFDSLFATSTKNDTPELSPAPFDVNRDGLVIGEGAGSLVLEDYEHARVRGARIYAEIVGFGTNSDGGHVTNPSPETMRIAMEQALEYADLQPEEIGYISAHGTGITTGDIAESNATHALFGNKTPISSLKSYTGHTLGACGALEAWITIEMMRAKWFAPTINLKSVDPLCADLDYIVERGRVLDCEYVMSNNFAFGGINTSLIFKRV